MSAIDINAVRVAVFRRLAADPAGAAFRAVFPSTGIVAADRLSEQAVPARPFAALRSDAQPRIERIVHVPLFRWWLYDDSNRDFRRINDGIGLLLEAYTEILWNPARGAIGAVEFGDISGELRDDSLGCITRSVQLAVYYV